MLFNRITRYLAYFSIFLYSFFLYVCLFMTYTVLRRFRVYPYASYASSTYAIQASNNEFKGRDFIRMLSGCYFLTIELEKQILLTKLYRERHFCYNEIHPRNTSWMRGRVPGKKNKNISWPAVLRWSCRIPISTVAKIDEGLFSSNSSSYSRCFVECELRMAKKLKNNRAATGVW